MKASDASRKKCQVEPGMGTHPPPACRPLARIASLQEFISSTCGQVQTLLSRVTDSRSKMSDSSPIYRASTTAPVNIAVIK
jgi:hypothetical protein